MWVSINDRTFHMVGTISLSVLRKLVSSILTTIYYFHKECPNSPIIHGCIQHRQCILSFTHRCNNLLYCRSDGSVKLDGFTWLCPEQQCAVYDFPSRVRKGGTQQLQCVHNKVSLNITPKKYFRRIAGLLLLIFTPWE